MRTKSPKAKYSVGTRMTLGLKKLLAERSKLIPGCRYEEGSVGLFVITAIKEKLSRDIESDAYWKTLL